MSENEQLIDASKRAPARGLGLARRLAMVAAALCCGALLVGSAVSIVVEPPAAYAGPAADGGATGSAEEETLDTKIGDLKGWLQGILAGVAGVGVTAGAVMTAMGLPPGIKILLLSGASGLAALGGEALVQVVSP
jgi:hypothetical protein